MKKEQEKQHNSMVVTLFIGGCAGIQAVQQK